MLLLAPDVYTPIDYAREKFLDITIYSYNFSESIKLIEQVIILLNQKLDILES